MADPAYVAGSLFQLARRLRRLYKRMRNASGEILKLRNRTKILAQTYEFFKDTMDNVGGLEELSHVFERHKKLIMGADDESKRTINRLTQLLDPFCSLMSGKAESKGTVETWVARFQWTRESKETIPLLFQDMKVLEGSMTTISTLVHTQLLSLQAKQGNGSDVAAAQFKSLERMLNIQYKKLRQAQRRQEQLMEKHTISPGRIPETKEFAKEVVKILKEEIGETAVKQSTSDSGSSPIEPEANGNSPDTGTLLSPSNSLRGLGSVISQQQQNEDVSSLRRQIPRQVRPQPGSSAISSGSPSSRRDERAHSHDRRDTTSEIHNRASGQDRGPLFGSPGSAPHTTARPASPNIPDSPSDAFDQQRQRHYGGPHRTRRRRNDSRVSEYGDGGEVTSTHRTGGIGLRSGRWNERYRGDQ